MEMVRFVTVAVVKPTSSALISYLPSGTAPKRYCPSLPVTSVWVKPVLMLRAVTATPGRTPPLRISDRAGNHATFTLSRGRGREAQREEQ